MKHNVKVARLHRKAVVLPLMMIAVVILLVLGTGLLALDFHVRSWAARTSSEIASRIAADAGLEKALYMMNQKTLQKPWNDNLLPMSVGELLPNCDAVFTYKVIKDTGGDYVITSVGGSGQWCKTVRATLEIKSVFDHAILSKDRIVLMPGTTVTGYNSDDITDTDIDVAIGTVSTESDRIPIGPGTVIDADVFVGVGGDPNDVIGAGGTITGVKYALPFEPEFPRITAPPLPDMGTGILTDGATLTLTPADSGQYFDIDISGGADGQVVIDGGTVVLHVTGDIQLGVSSEILVKSDASLILYIDGDIVSGNNSSIGYEGEPSRPKHLQIYATGDSEQTFDLKAKSSWSGVVYAPDVDIQIKAKGDIYGSLVANNVEFKSGGTIHYDEALKRVSADETGIYFVVKRWSEL